MLRSKMVLTPGTPGRNLQVRLVTHVHGANSARHPRKDLRAAWGRADNPCSGPLSFLGCALPPGACSKGPLIVIY